MAGEGTVRVTVAASEALTKHRLVSFMTTLAVLLLMADAIRRVLPDENEASALTWILVAAMSYAVIPTVFVQRRMPADRRTFFAWAIGLTPAPFGLAGVLNGSPPLLMWAGVALSACLVAFALATAQRRDPEPPMPQVPSV